MGENIQRQQETISIFLCKTETPLKKSDQVGILKEKTNKKTQTITLLCEPEDLKYESFESL